MHIIYTSLSISLCIFTRRAEHPSKNLAHYQIGQRFTDRCTGHDYHRCDYLVNSIQICGLPLPVSYLYLNILDQSENGLYKH